MLPYFFFPEINLGFFTLQTWGTMVALGFAVALGLTLKLSEQFEVERERVWEIFLWVLPGAFVGSKLLFELFHFAFGEPVSLSLTSGFSVAGALAGALATTGIVARKHRLDFFRLLDCLTLAGLVTLCFTRLGCFLLSDHLGSPTILPWGIMWTDGSVRHPVALYHLLMLAGLSLFAFQRIHVWREGQLFLFVSVSYAASTLLLDFTRCTDLTICDARYQGLTGSQWLSVGWLLFVVAWLLARCKPDKRRPVV